MWGAALRVNHDKTYGSTVVAFDPSSRTYPVSSAFAQDEVAIRPESVYITAGLKLEHNAFSGADVQPNLRARWLLPRRQLLWAAAARATRRPTRFDDDIQVTAPNGLVLVQGSDAFRSEVMTGMEVGYRARPLRTLALDATVFLQRYDRLRSQDSPVDGVVPATIGNTLNGRSSGLEVSGHLQPFTRWRVHGGYTYLNTEITRDPDSRDLTGGVSEANDPTHLATLRSAVDLGYNLELDTWLRGVGELPNPRVPGYVELNARVGWRPSTRIELALIGQDLLHAQHPEFGTAIPRRIEFERSVRASLTIRGP